MGAHDHRVRWTLDAEEEVFMVSRADPGNVDLLKTMPLPDSAARWNTDAKKHRWIRGAEFESK